jgi:phage tail-like protein
MKAAELATLLPAVFRRGAGADDVMDGLLEVMEMYHEPVEALLGRLDVIFDPRRAPERLVPVLARWVDLERIYASEPGGGANHIEDDIAMGRLRELVARSFELSQMRGTSAGLIAFLEIATGVRGFTIEEPPASDAANAFHLRVHVPAAAAPQLRLVERIVTSEKPAYTTWEPIATP